MKTIAILALGLLTLAPARPAHAYDETRMGSPMRTRMDTPQDFRRWADQRVDHLQKGFKTTGKAIDKYAEPTRRDAEGKLDGLKVRVSKVQGRLDELGDRDTKASWKDRKQVRSELRSIDKDYGKLQTELKGR